MKKSRVVLALSAAFAVLFLYYIKVLDQEIANLSSDIFKTNNVIDVTDLIKTRVYISSEELKNNEWLNLSYDDSNWEEVALPKYWIIKDKAFKANNFAYYRIKVPLSLMGNFKGLEDQVDLGLFYIKFKESEIFVNGKLFRKHKPKNPDESVINIPMDEKIENLVGIKAHLHSDDGGISHRLPIVLGKGTELNALHLWAYKGQTVLTLIYILCKGSILFIFTLIFFLVRVEKYFEKFLLFGIFAISEDFLRGDYLTKILSLDIRLNLYNLINVGIVVFLFLFLSDIVEKKLKSRLVIIGSLLLIGVTSVLTYHSLLNNYFFSIGWLLKFWNVALMAVVSIFFIPTLKKDKILFLILSTAFILTGWSTFFSVNVGHNLKALGNLLLFFMAAYQTFILFKREQELLVNKQIQLFDQEKDVAIGKTATILAHDVRRPLEQINLILNKVATGDFDAEFLKVAKRDVEFSITSVNSQISDIMNFSRTKEITLREIDVFPVLANSLKQVMSTSGDLDVKLEYQIESSSFVMGDESRLASVFTNLFSNALEAIRDIGKRTAGIIKISVLNRENYLLIKIYNDGPKIPEDIIQDIFKPLFTSGKSKGTGIGLATCNKIIKEHNGELKVENLESGVEFQMSLISSKSPAVFPADLFKSHSSDYLYKPRKTSLPEVKKQRLFLLDDDSQVYDYLVYLVQKLNLQVEITWAIDIETAREFVKSKRYDLYLLDYDLGSQCTGIDFYEEYLANLHCKAIIHSSRQDIPSSLEHVKKPIDEVTLNSLLSETLNSKPKIIVVDDSELTLMAWQIFHGDQNIKTFSSPESALSFIDKNGERFDVCVLDYYFDNSKVNGLELAQSILEVCPSMKIIISSNAELEGNRFTTISKNDFDIRNRI